MLVPLGELLRGGGVRVRGDEVRNSFTLKVESCGREASVFWNINDQTTGSRAISGAGREISFSIGGATSPCKPVSYQLFAYAQNGDFRASPWRSDRVC